MKKLYLMTLKSVLSVMNNFYMYMCSRTKRIIEIRMLCIIHVIITNILRSVAQVYLHVSGNWIKGIIDVQVFVQWFREALLEST